MVFTSVTVLGQGNLQAHLQVSSSLSYFHFVVSFSPALIALLLLLRVAYNQVGLLRYLLLPLVSSTLFPDIYRVMEEISSDCYSSLFYKYCII